MGRSVFVPVIVRSDTCCAGVRARDGRATAIGWGQTQATKREEAVDERDVVPEHLVGSGISVLKLNHIARALGGGDFDGHSLPGVFADLEGFRVGAARSNGLGATTGAADRVDVDGLTAHVLNSGRVGKSRRGKSEQRGGREEGLGEHC